MRATSPETNEAEGGDGQACRLREAETRNYVKRVIENLQVYRVRFDDGASLMSQLDTAVVGACVCSPKGIQAFHND
jgi:hypothetical protein